MTCTGATLGLWKGFQARSHMYTYERKAFLESKTLLKLIGLWTWGRVSLYKNLLLSLPLSRDIVIKQKTHKIVNKNIPFTLRSSWSKTARNYYNIEENTFLSIDFPFTTKLKSNCLYLTKLKVNKILPISMSDLLISIIWANALGRLGILRLMV